MSHSSDSKDVGWKHFLANIVAGTIMMVGAVVKAIFQTVFRLLSSMV